MAAFDYSRFVTTARTLVQRFGRAVNFRKLGETPADPAKPWDGPADARDPVAATLAASIVAVPPTGEAELGLSVRLADHVKRSEQIWIAEPAGALEDFDEAVEADGSVWQVTFVEKLRPGTDTILYYVGVRR